MGQGRHHGERAFEAFLRARRTPYVSVNEARRSLIPGDGQANLKSFDFVAYTAATSLGGANLLVDIKCRRFPAAPPHSPKLKLVSADGQTRPALATIRPRAPRLENWATREDIRSLRAWQNLFGPGFKAAFIFIYWCDARNEASQSNQPPDGLFDEVFLLDSPAPLPPRWYAIRGVLLDDYEPAMKDRSARWQTVNLLPHHFERLSAGFGRTWLGDKGQAPRAAAASGR